MSLTLLRFRPGARAWQEELSCEPDPRVVVASARELARWLEGAPIRTRVYAESRHEGVHHSLIAAPQGEPVWVPSTAVVPAENEGYALLCEAVTALGSRVERVRLERVLPEDSEWIQLGDEGDFVFVRCWDPLNERATGPMVRAFAIDVIQKHEIPARARLFEDEFEEPSSVLCPSPGAPTSAALLERFLRRWDAMREMGLVLLETRSNGDFSLSALEGEERSELDEAVAPREKPLALLGDVEGTPSPEAYSLTPAATQIQGVTSRAALQSRDAYHESRDDRIFTARSDAKDLFDSTALHRTSARKLHSSGLEHEPRDNRTSARKPDSSAPEHEPRDRRISARKPDSSDLEHEPRDNRTSARKPDSIDLEHEPRDRRTSIPKPGTKDRSPEPRDRRTFVRPHDPNAHVRLTPAPPEPRVRPALQRAQSPAQSPLAPKPTSPPQAGQNSTLAPPIARPEAPLETNDLAQAPLPEPPRLDAPPTIAQPSSLPAPLDSPRRGTPLADTFVPMAALPKALLPRLEAFVAPSSSSSAGIETKAPSRFTPLPNPPLPEPLPRRSAEARDMDSSQGATHRPPHHAILAPREHEAERDEVPNRPSRHASESESESRQSSKEEWIPPRALALSERQSPAPPRAWEAAPIQSWSPPPQSPTVQRADTTPASPLASSSLPDGLGFETPLPNPSQRHAQSPLRQWLLHLQPQAEFRPPTTLDTSSPRLPIASPLVTEHDEHHTLIEELVALPSRSAAHQSSAPTVDRTLVIGEIIVEFGVAEPRRRAPRSSIGSLIANLKSPSLVGRLR